MVDEVDLRKAMLAGIQAPPNAPAWFAVHRRAHKGHDYPCYGPRNCCCGKGEEA